MRWYKIKINKNNLQKVTNILLNNINDELKKGHSPHQKIALFYLNIDKKVYYYSYDFLDNNIDELYNSYEIVEIEKAKKLLYNQIYV